MICGQYQRASVYTTAPKPASGNFSCARIYCVFTNFPARQTAPREATEQHLTAMKVASPIESELREIAGVIKTPCPIGNTGVRGALKL